MGRPDDDAGWMKRAVSLARRGLGATYPNPSVGAVVVADGEMVGSGRTARAGGPHAEVRALQKAGARARGSTLHVTLEPCAHHGRTPPCVDAIVAAGVRRVVVGIRDPGPHVNGRGIRALAKAGVEVTLGVEAEMCRQVHEHYLHHCRTGRPFVTLKVALSLDGRVATHGGDSKWITGELARRDVHRVRAQHHAIAVGAATVRADDPALTVRHVRGTDPAVVVFDPGLDLARGSWQAVRAGALVLCARAALRDRGARVAARGAEPVAVKSRGGRLSIEAVLDELGQRSIRSLLVEGGGRLHTAFVEAGAWDEMLVYTGVRLLGDGLPFLHTRWRRMIDTPRVRLVRRRTFGEDVLTVLRPT